MCAYPPLTTCVPPPGLDAEPEWRGVLAGWELNDRWVVSGSPRGINTSARRSIVMHSGWCNPPLGRRDGRPVDCFDLAHKDVSASLRYIGMTIDLSFSISLFIPPFILDVLRAVLSGAPVENHSSPIYSRGFDYVSFGSCAVLTAISCGVVQKCLR